MENSIRDFRKAEGVSRKTLSFVTKISYDRLKRIENGRTKPTEDEKEKILLALSDFAIYKPSKEEDGQVIVNEEKKPVIEEKEPIDEYYDIVDENDDIPFVSKEVYENEFGKEEFDIHHTLDNIVNCLYDLARFVSEINDNTHNEKK